MTQSQLSFVEMNLTPGEIKVEIYKAPSRQILQSVSDTRDSWNGQSAIGSESILSVCNRRVGEKGKYVMP